MARNAKGQTAAERHPIHAEEEFQPRTPLGSRLWVLRKRIVASGELLLDWDDLEKVIAERRGGVSEAD